LSLMLLCMEITNRYWTGQGASTAIKLVYSNISTAVKASVELS